MTDTPLDAVLAERLTRAARAAQDLCDVLWEVLHEELSDRSPNGPRAQRVADLSERVADVSSTVAALASYTTPGVPEREIATMAEPPTEPEPEPAPTPEPARTPASSATSPAATSGAVIVDERAEPRTRARPLPWDEPPPREEMRVTRRAAERSATARPSDASF